MRVFLDTNVLVSAVATRGLCADVLREALTSQQLVVSGELLKELGRVLRSKIRVPETLVFEFMEFLQQDAKFSEASPGENLLFKDKIDQALVSAALNGEAELFVTGDQELLALRKIRKLEIVSPRLFWGKLTSSQGNKEREK